MCSLALLPARRKGHTAITPTRVINSRRLICSSTRPRARTAPVIVRAVVMRRRNSLLSKCGMGQGRPDSFASTLKVQKSAVGSGSGRHETARPMSQLGRFEPFADNATVRYSWHIPKLLPAASHRRPRKNPKPLTQSRGDPRIRRRPGARRVCPPQRRAIAAAGSGRMPRAPGSWTAARSNTQRSAQLAGAVRSCPPASSRFT
jgi:hypothetical protein